MNILIKNQFITKRIKKSIAKNKNKQLIKYNFKRVKNEN
jgi:hypothetical protein